MQLFTHLLSSYLQGMGDFFSALPRGGSSYLLCLRVFSGAPSPWGRLGWGSLCGSFPLGKAGMGLLCWLVRTPGNSEPIATPYYIYTLRCIVVSMVSLLGRGDDTKSFVPFQGFALCVCVWWRIFPRTGSRISATTHRHACPVAG